MKRTVRNLAAVILVGIALTSTADATTLGTADITNHSNNVSDSGTIYGGDYPNGIHGYTGVYSWSNAGGTGLGTQVPGWGFCIELAQPPYNGGVNVIPLDEAALPGTPMGITKANYIRELWGRDFDPAWATGANKQMAEAFSAAIWEILYETGPTWNVTSGTGFHATGIEQAAAANIWLSHLNGDTTYFANNLVAISTSVGQDYVVQVPVPVPVQAPEPATIVLLGLGAVVLRKKRK